MKGTLAETWTLVWTAARRQPRLPLLSGAVALCLAVWFLYVPPLVEIQRLNRRWGQIQQTREELRPLLDQYYQSGAGSLPESKQLPHLLEQLHELARQRGVEILSMEPGEIKGSGKEGLALCSVELQLQGEFRALGEFLGSLNNWEHLGAVSLQRVQVSREEGLKPRLRVSAAIDVGLQP